MSAPGIELRWGKGFEPDKPRKRERTRPFVREALDLAVEGLASHGLFYNERKRVIVDQLPSGEKNKEWGVAVKQTCHVRVTPEHVKRQWISDMVWLAATMSHELTHMVHTEYVPEYTMLSQAAAEGIACLVQYDVANALLQENGLKGPPKRVVENVMNLPKRDMNKLETAFWKASALPFDFDIQQAWFSRDIRLIGCSRGYAVGIHAVLQQLEQGYDLPELVQWEPYHVIDAA